MTIGILGARGIPNQYGGFEQFAEYLSKGLVERGHTVYVYSPHTHPYQAPTWEGVHLLHQHDPEKQLGTAGQFIYDLNSILDSRKRNFDVLLQLGYTSSSVWGWLLPGQSVVITNMDGLEWKRAKYRRPVRAFLKYAEKLGVQFSQHLVADSVGIQTYLQQTYGKPSTYIPYGADIFEHPSESALAAYAVQPHQYNLLIARLEPENNLETILAGTRQLPSPMPLLVVGNHQSAYGQYLKQNFTEPHIHFLGPVYDRPLLDNLRHFCYLYFHGHTVGGTNPSLLEAMAAGAFVCAHRNPFNESILGPDARYFTDSASITQVLHKPVSFLERKEKVFTNIEKIRNQYAWNTIIDQYEQLMERCVNQSAAINTV